MANGGTEAGQENGYFGRLVEGPLKAGTKIRLKGIVDAPGDPSARLFALEARAVGMTPPLISPTWNKKLRA